MDSFASNLISAVIGGVLSGGFTVFAVQLAHKHNMRVQKAKQQRVINGTLRAIKYKLEVQNMLYSSNIGGQLQKAEPEEPFLVRFSLTEKYFIVYPSNTATIGQIEDPELSKAIVDTYNMANYLLESFRINNLYLEGREELLREKRFKSSDPLDEQIYQLEQHLTNHVTRLKRADESLKNHASVLIALIDKYLADQNGS